MRKVKARAIYKVAVLIGPDEWGMTYVSKIIDLPDNFFSFGHFVGFASDDEHEWQTKEGGNDAD